MTPGKATVALLALALLLSAPAAFAHVETFTQSKTIQAGPYTLFVSPQPEIVFANTTMTVSAIISRSDTGSPARDVTATFLVAGPDDLRKRTQMRDDRSGLLVASMLLPQRGVYSVRILVTDANSTHNADMELEAYPDLPVRVHSADAEQDVFTNQSTKLLFEVVNRTRLTPDTENVTDLRVLFEHWDDNHVVMYGTEEIDGKHIGDGKWEFDHTFRGRGMYHIKFASRSGGFTYSDVPVLHLYATTKLAEPGTNQVPASSVPALALGVLAAAALVVARRRLAA